MPISREIRRFAISVVMGTHPGPDAASPLVRQFVRYGSSPRGAQALILAAKICAVIDGRYHVAKGDIRSVARPTLRHRVLLNFEGQAEAVSTDAIIDDVLDNAGKEAAGVS